MAIIVSWRGRSRRCKPSSVVMEGATLLATVTVSRFLKPTGFDILGELANEGERGG
jgi:hypothetical protein